MPDTEFDVWPEIKLDVVSPLIVLRRIAATLERKSNGAIKAEVTKVPRQDDWTTYELSIVAPLIGKGYRQSVLTLLHKSEVVYPVTIKALGFEPFFVGQDSDVTTANTDSEVRAAVAQALQSPHVVSLVHSLIAMSNERTGAAVAVG